MLKLNGFDGPWDFRVDFFWRGEYVVTGSAGGVGRIAKCRFRSSQNVFEAVGGLFNGVVALL